MKIRIAIVLMAGVLPGCLTTVQEMRDKETKPAITPAQERQAQLSTKFDETDQQMRSLSGRVEVLENQLTQLSDGRQSQQAQALKDYDSRLKAYEETLTKLEAQVRAMDDQINILKAAKSSAPVRASQGKEAFQAAESAYAAKDYKQAIVDFEAYRKSSPKGKSYPQATLKIGISFHELGMRDEAKSFYEEVIAKFPTSPEAKKASQRLKGMK